MIRKDYGDIITLYEKGKIRKETPKEVVDKLLETSDTWCKKCPFIGKHRFNVSDSFVRPWTNNNSILTIVGIDYQAREYICNSSLFPEPTIRVSFADDYRLQPVCCCACPCCKPQFKVGDIVHRVNIHRENEVHPSLKIIEVDCRKEKYLVANILVPSYHFYIPFDESLMLVCSAHSGMPCCKNCCKCGLR